MMTTTTYESFAYDGTKTRRREDRRDVRESLGTSRQPAPDIHDALRAGMKLNQIMDDASGGRYLLRVFDKRTGEIVTFYEALGEAKRAHDEGRSRL